MHKIDEIIKLGDGGKSEKLSRWNNRIRELTRKKSEASPNELKRITDEITDIHSRISKLQSEQTEPIMTHNEDIISEDSNVYAHGEKSFKVFFKDGSKNPNGETRYFKDENKAKTFATKVHGKVTPVKDVGARTHNSVIKIAKAHFKEDPKGTMTTLTNPSTGSTHVVHKDNDGKLYRSAEHGYVSEDYADEYNEDIIEDIELNDLLDRSKVAEAASLEEAKDDPIKLKKQLEKYKANIKFAKDDKAKATIQTFIDNIQDKLDTLDEAFGKKDDDSDDDADGKDDDNDGKADDDDDEADDDDSKGEDKDKPKPAFLKNLKKESSNVAAGSFDIQEGSWSGVKGGGTIEIDINVDPDDKAGIASAKKQYINRGAITVTPSKAPNGWTSLKISATTSVLKKIIAGHYGSEAKEMEPKLMAAESLADDNDDSKDESVMKESASVAQIEQHIENMMHHLAVASKKKFNDLQIQNYQEILAGLRSDLGKAKAKAQAKKLKKESFISDMNSLIEESGGLSEDFKEKAGTIFEVALNTRIRVETEQLQEEFDTKLIEEVAAIRESLEEKVDNYLTYAVESWVEDNKLAVESGLRTEVAESFISSLKSVFVEHYIEVPETKKDIVSELETKLVSVEEALCASSKQTHELTEQVEKLVREKILVEAAESLADTQGARLQALAEDVEFVDEETFRKKVATIKECYFQRKGQVIEEEALSNSFETTEVIIEDSDSLAELSPTMQNYVKALARVNKANTFTR